MNNANTATEILSIGDLFGLPIPKEITIERAVDASSPFIPKACTEYVFRKEILSDFLAWMKLSDQLNDALYLTGPTGSGKSSIVTEICARLHIPLQRVAAHSRMEMPELTGHHVIIDGDTIWQDGPLTTAMRYGHMFLLDEMDLLDPATAAGLNGIVEGAPLVLSDNGGEVIHPHPNFRFVATGNTAGGGDRSGLYQGTLQQNAAFMDRTMIIKVGYSDADVEMGILAGVPGITDEMRKSMISIANDVRSQFIGENETGGSLDITMSTRTLVRWATLTSFFVNKRNEGLSPAMYALDRALLNRANPETATAVREIAQRYLA